MDEDGAPDSRLLQQHQTHEIRRPEEGGWGPYSRKPSDSLRNCEVATIAVNLGSWAETYLSLPASLGLEALRLELVDEVALMEGDDWAILPIFS